MILFLVLTVAAIASIICVVASFAGQGVIAGNMTIFLLFLLFTSGAPTLCWIMFGVVMMFSLVGLALNATTPKS
jgi:hypothetical protein